MAKSSLPKLIIFGDAQRRYVSEAVAEFVEFSRGRAEILANCFKGDCAVDVLNNADFAIVFGGDGTILSAARDLSETDVPVIGVNMGKLGFLAEFTVDEVKGLFDRIISDSSLIGKRMILDCGVEGGEGVKFHSPAINDIVITAGAGFSMIELKMTVDGEPIMGFSSDGVIISTPTGSTAYNLSAGGPILSANISSIVITPICPHSLNFRPIVVSDEAKIEILPVRVNDGTTLTTDGQVNCKLIKSDIVKVQKHKGKFLVVHNPLRTLWQTLAGKLNWAEAPKYRASENNEK